MGVDFLSKDCMATHVEGNLYKCMSDAEGWSSVEKVLGAVRMAPLLIAESDKDRYNFLLSIVDPHKGVGLKQLPIDEEALFAATLRELSGAISKLDITYHGALLNNIFALRLWSYREDTRAALLQLITGLAAVADKFLESCLHMILSNFVPSVPPNLLGKLIDQDGWLERKTEIHSQLHNALQDISSLVPVAPLKFKDMIETSMPKLHEDKAKIMVFVECMLGLKRDKLGEIVGNTLLAKVMDLLTELDVNIRWSDVVQEDNNKGMFEMELEDIELEEDVYKFGTVKQVSDGATSIACAEKLDSLMVIFCEYLKSCADEGQILKEFNMLLDIFRRSVLRLHRSKFSQFVIFYACSLDPDTCGVKFADFLLGIFLSKSEDPVTRVCAVSYLGSYLSRARFISTDIVVDVLKRLVQWCLFYCQCQNSDFINPKAHRVYYAGCQAVMYILCFRMGLILNHSKGKSWLCDLPLEFILFHPRLQPMKVCLPIIVQEFLQQVKAAQLFQSQLPTVNENIVESEWQAFGASERLDMFFPFDPCLLKESDRFIRPNFQSWSMVSTTYSHFEETEVENVDPELEGNVGLYVHDIELDYDTGSDGDDLDYNMNNMSITPKPSLPARMRPSTSPPP